MVYAYVGSNLSSNETLVDLIGQIASNPYSAIAMGIQFLLGFAAGYYMAKIARYVIALVAVFVVGALIGVWGTSSSVEDAIKSLGQRFVESKDAILSLVHVFGFILVGPTAVGFVVGLLAGMLRH